jgi:hypothetical protein
VAKNLEKGRPPSLCQVLLALDFAIPPGKLWVVNITHLAKAHAMRLEVVMILMVAKSKHTRGNLKIVSLIDEKRSYAH